MVRLFVFLSLFSCASLVEKTKRAAGVEPEPPRKKVTWVSQDQYDELLVKYKNLNDDYQRTIEAQAVMEREKEIEIISSVPAIEQTIAPAPKKLKTATSRLAKLVSQYEKAKILMLNGKQDQAVEIFRSLEKSGERQIVVRSKYEIGKSYNQQGQFDLGLQVFETIIEQYSFSAVTIEALKGAMLSSHQLGLDEKKQRYRTVLRDFFGMDS